MGVYLPCNQSTYYNNESFPLFDGGSQRLLCLQDVQYILYGRNVYCINTIKSIAIDSQVLSTQDECCMCSLPLQRPDKVIGFPNEWLFLCSGQAIFMAHIQSGRIRLLANSLSCLLPYTCHTTRRTRRTRCRTCTGVTSKTHMSIRRPKATQLNSYT